MKFDEQIIKEKRTIEATKKEYLGPSSKFVIISRTLGEEMIQQGENNNYIKYDNFWEDNAPQSYKMMDENTPINSIGYYFYGLKYSCQLEIYFLEYEKTTKVVYMGDKVYEEINGELECYVPNDSWESLIENLYKLAKEKEVLIKSKEKEKKKIIFQERKKYFLDKIKKVWGV